MQVNKNKQLEEINKSLSDQIEDLQKEMFDYKAETQDTINSKNNELVDLHSRLAVIDQDYISKFYPPLTILTIDQINMLVYEKNKLQNQIDIESSEAELLTMKLSILSNKIKTVIEQKGFLLDNVESCIDNLKHEWTKRKEHCQRQMVISGEKAVEQLEELLMLMINSFEGVKDVIKFMSFEELEIVGFQTQTVLENKADKTNNDTIGIGDLDEHVSDQTSEQSKTIEDKESINSEVKPEQFHEWYDDTSKQREKLRNVDKNNDKSEISAMVNNIKARNEERKSQIDLKADPDLNPTTHNDAFTKFSKTNFTKNRQPKLHKNLNPFSKHESDLKMSKTGSEQIKLDEKSLEDLQEFVFPDLDKNKLKLTTENSEEFLSKHWIEIMEVLYDIVKDIFFRIGNIQVNDEVSTLFTHIQNCSNKNIVKYIYSKLFSKQKYMLDQYWFKVQDRLETLETQKNDLKKQIMNGFDFA